MLWQTVFVISMKRTSLLAMTHIQTQRRIQDLLEVSTLLASKTYSVPLYSISRGLMQYHKPMKSVLVTSSQ